MNRYENFMLHYNLLKKYKEEYGNIDVPKNYIIDGVKLGIWLSAIRNSYSNKGTYKITEEYIKLLEELGVKWSYRSDIWEEYYSILEKYYELHGNINVPIDYELFGYNLGEWLKRQRIAYLEKSTSHIKKQHQMYLNDLGMDWSVSNTILLNRKIEENNKKKYNKVLLNRLNHIIDDLVFEELNVINSKEDQEKIEREIIKRLFR